MGVGGGVEGVKRNAVTHLSQVLRVEGARAADFVHGPPVHVTVGVQRVVQELHELDVVGAKLSLLLVLPATDDGPTVVQPRVRQHELVDVR